MSPTGAHPREPAHGLPHPIVLRERAAETEAHPVRLLHRQRPEITGPDAAAFTLGTVPPQVAATEIVGITFTPTAEKAYAATLVITNNDENAPVIEISLTGEGANPKAVVPGNRMSYPGVSDPAKRAAIIDYVQGLR